MAANAAICVAHVCAFVSALHFKGDASEIFRVHAICDYASNEKEISRRRVSWQTFVCSFVEGAVGFIDWR
jgi:hypothetical protein